MIRFIVNSFLFKKALYITLILIGVFVGASYVYDYLWKQESFFILKNLGLVYRPPLEYDNATKINLKLEDFNKISIEGNKKFTLVGSNKKSVYYDTVLLKFPEQQNEQLNIIYLKFDAAPNTDSIYIVVSRSDKEKVFWKQIFLSSVYIEKLNSFSSINNFKVEDKQLYVENIINDNDSLIKQVYKYFNENVNCLNLGNCGKNSQVFKSICDKFLVPCRIVSLQGGDALYTGLDKTLGYPLHAVCEVYSSKLKKWFVVDPTYGLTYTDEKEVQNAVEISKALFFNRIHRLSQDSILVTKSSFLGRDYFKYYENIYFETGNYYGFTARNILRIFYKNFNTRLYQYSSNISNVKDGYYYAGIKTIMYLIIVALHFNIMMYLILKRLVTAKKKI